MKSTFFLLSVLLLLQPGKAQDLSQYESREFTRNGNTLLYRILYPLHYEKNKQYPVVLFLHGSGERGNDNKSQLVHGGAMFLEDSLRENYPAFVIFPQCPRDSAWSYVGFSRDTVANKNVFLFPYRDQPPVVTMLVKELLDSMVRAKAVDKKRCYIGGLSLGGFGVFDILARYPDYFAAAFPICGAGNTDLASRFAHKLPLWIFHGGADPVVPVEYSRNYYHALQALGADVRYTEYPGVGHNSWDNVFVERGLPHWLFSNKKGHP